VPQPRRGEIYAVNFARTEGARISKTRPAVVVQNDIGNRYAPHTIVVAIRRAEGKGTLPVFVLLPQGTAGLTKQSLIDCGHITTVATDQLGKRLGILPPELIPQLNTALKRSLDLP
jgi:mRNA interferase MazF